MEYVVFKSGGKQYKASVGDVIDLDKIAGEINKTIVLENILLWASDEQLKLGKPSLADIKVSAKVLDQFKGEKLTIHKYKAKVRYRKTMGFRPMLTKIKIEKIEGGSVNKTKPAAPKKSTKK